MGELERYEGAATIEKVAALSRRRGFVYPSSDIYGGLGSSFDYGHYGVLLKQNVKAEWQRSMVQEREDIVLLDSAIILNPQVWVASTSVKITTARLPSMRASASWRSATVSTRGWRTVTNGCSGNCASVAATTRVAVSPVASETTCSSTTSSAIRRL